MGEAHGANGLRSLFLRRASESTLQKSFEHDVEKHNRSIPYTGVSATANEMKSTKRSRNETLEDCQKLVSEILREHPEGCSISSFPRLFVDRYGYRLDLNKLGYQKLANLLQMIPEVKVESAYIYPCIRAVRAYEGETFNLYTNACHANGLLNSDGELSDSASKDNNMESPWEELGPDAANYSNQSSLESELSRKAKELDTSKCPDYEPIVLQYVSSKSEGDSDSRDHPEERGKPKCNEQDSYFCQALELLNSREKGEKC
ncbi:hypothetical protein VNO78_02032 [Psophocarpus tetragonolobus]|uniref:HTH OST-type domain-containing protein n=1 Tax=Psophocarpus tetragonolobus TaxID=3891 RepID=A0AAN9SYD7_PSOTE